VLLLTQPIDVIAIGVTWPIIVLKAKEVIAPHDTPFRRIAVPKSSAGIAQLSGPLVMKKTATSVSGGARRSTQASVTQVKEPCEGDESPVRTSVVGICRVNLDDRRVYDESNAQEQAPEDL
jgi:hypothetical protein